MNLRILKKLSKRAAPYLPLLGDNRQQFPAEKGENYHGLIVRDWNRVERVSSCHPESDFDERTAAVIAPRGRAGSTHPYVHLWWPYHPLKGTVMVGEMSGYETPEWSEETAWGALTEIVFWHFTEYNPEYETLDPTRTYHCHEDFFRAADEMLADRTAA